MRQKLTVALVFLILGACSPFKSSKIFDLGGVSPLAFHESIPLSTRLNLRIAKVQINGESYDFLLDTGAPTLVSNDLFNKLGLSTKDISIIRDSQGNRGATRVGLLSEIYLGDVKFENIPVYSFDLAQNPALACLKIDGIIGANLMQHAIWEIDFPNNQLTISNTPSSSLAPGIPFTTSPQKSPYLNVNLGDQKSYSVLLDLGFNGEFDLAWEDFDELSSQKTLEYPQVALGASGYGLMGKQSYDTIKQAQLAELRLSNDLKFSPATEFAKNSKRKVGVDLFKHGKLTLNWKTGMVHFEETESQKTGNGLQHYGFKPTWKDGFLVVDLLYDSSQAKELGLQLGDTLMSWNRKVYASTNPDAYCEFLSDYNTESPTLEVVVKRGVERETLVLNLIDR